jgi:hypothetical protein
VVHGELEGRQALKERILREKGWDVLIPEHQQVVELN